MELLTDVSDDWFTVERLADATYAISEYGHWEQSHSYLVLGSDRAALIDTGLGIGDIRAVVERITRLPTDVITTHVHWDHIGGHDSFEHIAVHHNDADWLRHGIPVPVESLRASLTREAPTQPYPDGFRPEAWKPFTGEPTRLLHDEDTVDLGGRSLRIVHTPGHSPGHLCVHDPSTGTLFTGDLIYHGELYAFYPSTDPLAFYDSVDRLTRLDGIQRLAPGHHSLDVGVDNVRSVAAGLRRLDARGRLHHGSGTHRLTEDITIVV